MQRNIWFCVKVTKYLEIDNILEICFGGQNNGFRMIFHSKKWKRVKVSSTLRRTRWGGGLDATHPRGFSSISLTAFIVSSLRLQCLFVYPCEPFGKVWWQSVAMATRYDVITVECGRVIFLIKMRIFTIFRWKNLWNATKSIKMFNCIKCYNSSKQ